MIEVLVEAKYCSIFYVIDIELGHVSTTYSVDMKYLILVLSTPVTTKLLALDFGF